MKKFLILIISIMVAMLGYSQDKTVNIKLPNNGTYAYHSCSASDTLVDAGQDSIDYVWRYNGAVSVDKVSIGFNIDTISAVDNGVVYSLYGKEFEDDLVWTAIIAQDTTADVAGVDQFYADKMATIATDKSFRYFRQRMFMEASSGTGDKLKVNSVVFKTYVK